MLFSVLRAADAPTPAPRLAARPPAFACTELASVACTATPPAESMVAPLRIDAPVVLERSFRLMLPTPATSPATDSPRARASTLLFEVAVISTPPVSVVTVAPPMNASTVVLMMLAAMEAPAAPSRLADSAPVARSSLDVSVALTFTAFARIVPVPEMPARVVLRMTLASTEPAIAMRPPAASPRPSGA